MRSVVNSDRELDRILDEALASYGAMEPRPGLERRVLHRVRAASVRRRWLLLVPVLAALLLAIGIRLWPGIRTIDALPPQPSSIARAPVIAAPRIAKVIARSARPRVFPRREGLPRKALFPTPSPLTPDERALLFLASKRPGQTEDFAAHREIEPIEISELQITPLPDSGE